MYKKRHAKADEERRTYRPALLLTKSEWERVKAVAYAQKMSISDWIIRQVEREEKCILRSPKRN